MQSEPRNARVSVWPLSLSLAATQEIDVSFSSSGYLDVSVPRVPFLTLWIGVRITEVLSVRFPHSDIHGSLVICTSPWLFAAYHVFRRLLVPRHPPCALLCLTSRCIALQHLFCLKKLFSVLLNFWFVNSRMSWYLSLLVLFISISLRFISMWTVVHSYIVIINLTSKLARFTLPIKEVLVASSKSICMKFSRCYFDCFTSH